MFRPIPLLFATLALTATVVEGLPEFEAKDLPQVAGPLAPHYPDPGLGMGDSPMDRSLRAGARQGGTLPGVALPATSCVVKDRVQGHAGWKAYKLEVPAAGGFKVRLHGLHEGWFVVKVLNRWGNLEEGMLQNRIPTGNPQASYKNPRTEPRTVYIVVDTTELNTLGEEYSLKIERS